MKHVCNVCGWEYNTSKGYPVDGIKPNTSWEDVPEDFACPMCGTSKDNFREVDAKSLRVGFLFLKTFLGLLS